MSAPSQDAHPGNELSPSQHKAVHHPLRDACVMAGAGSGKTRVLTSRYTHLVRDVGLSPRDIAAITFTEKAADEMRDRIAKSLKAGACEATKHAADSATITRLRDARGLIEFAPISTIHSFCARLIRRHALVAGVDPQFTVLEPSEQRVVFESALSETLDAASRTSPLDLIALNRLPSAPSTTLKYVVRGLRTDGCRPSDLHWHAGATTATQALAQLARAVEEAAADAPGFTDSQASKWPTTHQALREAIERVAANAKSAPGFDAPRLSKLVSSVGTSGKVWKPHWTALKAAIPVLAGALWDEWAQQHVFPSLARLATDVFHRIEQKKRDLVALDFTDLETRALLLLKRLKERGEPVQRAPRILLGDEYQDTSRLEAKIFAHLRDQASMFSVGDPKQSIYRFRRADVNVLLHEWEGAEQNGRHVLSDSYRTSPELLAVVNGIHAQLFAGRAAGVDYEPLVAKADFDAPSNGGSPANDNSPPNDNSLANDNSPAERNDLPQAEFVLMEGHEGSTADERRSVEAHWIAKRILALVAASVPVRKENSRPIRFLDMAILVRAGGTIPALEDALLHHGIPFLTQSSKGYFLADEIDDLMAALRVLHNPEDHHALASLATSPSLRASDADLSRWFLPSATWRGRSSGKEPGLGEHSPWRVLTRELSDHASLFGEPVRGRWNAFVALQARVPTLSLTDAIRETIDALDMSLLALTLPRGLRRAANLDKALDIARAMDANGHHDLPAFLARVAQLRAHEVKEHEAPVGGEGQDVVRISTMHSAKGLEYSVVFLPDLTRSRVASRPDILTTPTGGIAARVRHPLEYVTAQPLGHMMLGEEDARAEEQEALRLLYVATTRAKERLYMSGTIPKWTTKGTPSHAGVWGRRLWNALGEPDQDTQNDVPFGPGSIRATMCSTDDVLAIAASPRRELASTPVRDAASKELDVESLVARTKIDAAPLNRTRYVVSVSDLLTFAQSPAMYYERCVLGVSSVARPAFRPQEAEAQVSEHLQHLARHVERAQDEAVMPATFPQTSPTRVPRQVLGRVVHGALEHLEGENSSQLDAALDYALDLEAYPGDAVRLRTMSHDMLSRFCESPLGQEMMSALKSDLGLLREVDLHARIRFPSRSSGNMTVAGLDSLLVKGSIDLWLPRKDGVWIIDFKTNRRGGRIKTTEDLKAIYAWQLRLYALMAERVLGEDVAGAALVLLDPSWASTDPVVPVSTTGEDLLETRRLCEALAQAELEGRYPQHWSSLVSDVEAN